MPFSTYIKQSSKLDYRTRGAKARMPQRGVVPSLHARIAKCLILLGDGLASFLGFMPRSYPHPRQGTAYERYGRRSLLKQAHKAS